MILDLRLALRRLRRSPGFALTAIATLSIAIAATTTIVSLANAFLWRPLPIHEPERVVRVYRNRTSNSS